MPPAALAPLSYETWVVRRTSADSLRVLYAAVARGRGHVLVPLPWPDARLLDETPDRAPFWALHDLAQRCFDEQSPFHHRSLPPHPLGARDVTPDPGERGARLLSRAALPPEIESLLPESWAFARSFIGWPAQPERRGLAAWLSRRKVRQLAPVALSAESASSPFRTDLERFELAVAAFAESADIYLIDSEELVGAPWYPSSGPEYCEHWTGIALPGLVEPRDHVHWSKGNSTHPDAHPHAPLSRFQRLDDALSDFEAERRERMGKT